MRFLFLAAVMFATASAAHAQDDKVSALYHYLVQQPNLGTFVNNVPNYSLTVEMPMDPHCGDRHPTVEAVVAGNQSMLTVSFETEFGTVGVEFSPDGDIAGYHVASDVPNMILPSFAIQARACIGLILEVKRIAATETHYH